MSDEKYVGAAAAAKQAVLIKAYVDSKMKKDFVVNITFDNTSAPAIIDDANLAVFNASADKTFAEISSAVAAGRNVYGMCDGLKWPLYLAGSTSFAFRGHIQLANLFGTVGLAIAICSIWKDGCNVEVSAGELPAPALDGTDDGKVPAINGTKWELKELPVDDALSATSTNPVQNKVVKTALDGKAGTAAATQTANGLMSSADKVKLDGVEDGATKTIVDDAMSDTSTNPVQNKAVKAALDGKLSTQGGEILGHLSVGLTVSAEGSVSTGRTSTDTGIHFEKAGSDVGRISHGSDPMTGVSPIARLKVASPTEDDDAATKAYVDGRAVRYDAAQTLTDAQKAQARENVDAASAFAPILTSPVMIRKERATDSAGVYLSTIDIGEKHAEIRLEDVNENAPVAIANLRTPTGAGTDNYAATKGYVDSKVASGGGGVTVDDAMSDTSTNPVQNKTIKQYVDDHAVSLPLTLTYANGQATGAAYTDIRKAIERGRQIKLSVANTPDIIASNARNKTDKSVLNFIHTDVGGDTTNITQYTVTAQASGLTVNVKSHEIA